MEKDWVKVHESKSREDGELIKSTLTENGIDSMILEQDNSAKVELWVHESQRKAAKTLLDGLSI